MNKNVPFDLESYTKAENRRMIDELTDYIEIHKIEDMNKFLEAAQYASALKRNGIINW